MTTYFEQFPVGTHVRYRKSIYAPWRTGVVVQAYPGENGWRGYVVVKGRDATADYPSTHIVPARARIELDKEC